MGRPFDDITLYIPTSYSNTSPEYLEETSLHNFVSDLYVQKMDGYKPPNSTRVCIQPAYYGIWDRTWKNGSIFSIACEFLRDKYASLETRGKYHYILDIIQEAMLQLSDEYNWDKAVFEKTYRDVVACDFIFSIDYPQKGSPDKRKRANLRVEKNETTTFAYAVFETANSSLKIKLFEKKNSYWYDCVYRLSPLGKWLDSDRFGIYYSKGQIEVYYSIKEEKVCLLQSGQLVQRIEFSKFFLFQQ